MRYAREFFDLQVDVALAIARRAALPLARALLDYTNLYIRFGLGRAFDPEHPVWRTYAAGCARATDVHAWTYELYLTRPAIVEPPALVATFGCFGYSRLGDDRLRLHFHDAETDGRSPLGVDRREQRRAELVALTAHLEASADDTARVIGASWLYNLDAYRRLFPPAYLASAQVLRGRFRHMPLWGQFLNRDGKIRESMAWRLRERVEHADVARLDECFPFQVIGVDASVRKFCDFYGV